MREPRSIHRVWTYILISLAGLAVGAIPPAGLLITIMGVSQAQAPDSALYGLAWWATILIPALVLASTAYSRDRVLFFSTPLVPRQYFRRRFQLKWPIHAALLVGTPLATVLTSWLSPVQPDKYAWSTLQVMEFTSSYYAVLLAPLAWSLRYTRFELPSNFGRSRKQQLRDTMLLMSIYPVVGFLYFFWADAVAVLRAAAEVTLENGEAGVFALGLVSPGSLLSVQSAGIKATAAGSGLTVLWLAVAGLELRMIFRTIRLQKPRFELPEALATVVSVQINQDSAATVQPMGVAQDGTDSSSNGIPYDIESTPERRFFRLLRCSRPLPEVTTKSQFISFFLFRFPRLFGVIAFALLMFAEEIFEESSSELTMLLLFCALYSNLMSGLRWTRALRTSIALPLRLNRLALSGNGLRLGYRLGTDAAVAGLAAGGSNVYDFVSIFSVLVMARAGGQIRSWMSLLSVSGLRRATWLYEFPLISAPFVWLMIMSFLFDLRYLQGSQLNGLSVAFAGTGVLYGLLLAWLFCRRTDTSVPRLTSSYRPSADRDAI